MNPALPAGWPEGRSLAVSVNVMLEGWSDGAAPGVGPMGNVLKAGATDFQALSWAEYGANAGAWRLLDVLAAAGVRAVFYVSGVLAEGHPELMRAIVAAGHVVAAHGWGQQTIPATQAVEDEARDLQRCIEALEAASGQRPRGWISPRCTPSARTTALLAAAGHGLAQRLFRPGPAAGSAHAVRADHGRAVHDGGERHAAKRALWQ